MTDNVDKGGYSKPYKKSSYKEASVAEEAPVVAEVVLDDVEPVLPPMPAPEPVPVVVVADPLSAAEKDAVLVAQMIAEEREIVKNRAVAQAEVSNAELVEQMIAEERAVIKARAAVKEVVFDDKAAAAIKAQQAALQKKIDSLYTIGVWETFKNYECKVCPYSTLDAELIRSHVRKHI